MLAAICVAALVAGTVGAMAYTQSLRKEGPIASEIRFKDLRGDGTAPFEVCFQLPREDTIDVEIVESGSGDVAATLATAERLGGDLADHCYEWDGVNDDGEAAGEGIYRLRITLADADRAGTSGEKIRIEEPVAERRFGGGLDRTTGPIEVPAEELQP